MLKYSVRIIFVIFIVAGIGCSRKRYVLDDATKNSVEKLTALIKENPKGADLYYYRASLNMKNGNAGSALTDMLDAVKIDSSKGEYYLLLGDVYFSKLFIAQA